MQKLRETLEEADEQLSAKLNQLQNAKVLTDKTAEQWGVVIDKIQRSLAEMNAIRFEAALRDAVEQYRDAHI